MSRPGLVVVVFVWWVWALIACLLVVRLGCFDRVVCGLGVVCSGLFLLLLAGWWGFGLYTAWT